MSQSTRIKPNCRKDYSTFETMTTRWADNDIYRHMNNVIHYQLFDTAVNGYLLKQSLLNLEKCDTIFLVVQSGCNYFSQISFPDIIHAGLKVTKLGRTSVTYEIALFRNSEELSSATGHFVHISVDRETHKPTPLSDDARAILTSLM